MAQTIVQTAMDKYRKQVQVYDTTPMKPRIKPVHSLHDQSPIRLSPVPGNRSRQMKKSRFSQRFHIEETSQESVYPKYTPLLVQSSAKEVSEEALISSTLLSEETRPVSRIRPRRILYHTHEIWRDPQQSTDTFFLGVKSERIHGQLKAFRKLGTRVTMQHERTSSVQKGASPSVSKSLYGKLISLESGQKSISDAETVRKPVIRKVLKSDLFFQPPKVTVVAKRSDSKSRHSSRSRREDSHIS